MIHDDARTLPPYRLVVTPGGRFARHVIDCQGRVHLGLTATAAYLNEHYSPATANKYFGHARHCVSRGALTGGPGEDLAPLVAKYLRDHWNCRLRLVADGEWRVQPLSHSRSTIVAVLAALQALHGALVQYRLVPPGQHPFRKEGRPRFHVAGGLWQPKYVFQPSLREVMLAASETWPEWAALLGVILFDCGCRVFEACDLRVADWRVSNFGQYLRACNKGSDGERRKTIVITSPTAVRLAEYFNTTRRRHAGAPCLAEAADQDHLLVTTRGTPATPGSFRDRHWRPAARRHRIPYGPHGARHWYVTMRVAQILQEANSEAEVAREISRLIAYIKWARHETINSYDHTFGLSSALAFEPRRQVASCWLAGAEQRIGRDPSLLDLLGDADE
ncbi:MAG: site-specific integrase [Alphaproteobacteria bacterium]|nr:site-specific integrase [Alphaproteobacteria bacterium]